MFNIINLNLKSIKHFYHAGMYGSKDSAKKDHDEQIKYSKEYICDCP